MNEFLKDRRSLSKAITLIESSLVKDQEKASELIEKIMPNTGNSLRIGISGVPGVGKSTFIESLGMYLINKRHKVAVLAVDPSSPIHGGSILGDKTRMEKLSSQDNAYIRPSPTKGTLGGVGKKTREIILLCEAAGYDIILIETVGVGQSEIEVHSMSDFFLMLMLPGAGDELQGIKKGILEIVDAIAVNKAEDDNQTQAKVACQHYQNALHILEHKPHWTPPVLSCSALKSIGIEDIWNKIKEFEKITKDNGEFKNKRLKNNQFWFEQIVNHKMITDIKSLPEWENLRTDVLSGIITPQLASLKLFDALYSKKGKK
jgi:LAO/AO transport system kinase